jgi:hypothetical protein
VGAAIECENAERLESRFFDRAQLLRLTTGDMLIPKTKGQEADQDRVKRRYLDEWVQAVNEQGGFGRWR